MKIVLFVVLCTLASVASGAPPYSYSRVYNSRGQQLGTIKTGRDNRYYIGPQGKITAIEKFSVKEPYGKSAPKTKR